MNTERWPENAEVLISRERVAGALDQQARRLELRLADVTNLTLMILMNGGLYPGLELARRLHRPFRLDYVHATRYRDQLEGGQLRWDRWPSRVEGTILLVDDIFDEGLTLQAVKQRLMDDGAEAVLTVTLTTKQHDRGLPRDWVDDAALEVPDRYVFGCGMDWHGYWRQLDDIWAI
jgi:hypoxanthine phosphoribosyltransferase